MSIIRWVRERIVSIMEDACNWTGHRGGCQLAAWSCDLNDRWGLDHWGEPEENN